MKNLNGKVALVTGGSRGIGAAIAKRLAKEGATVVITYYKSQNKAEELVEGIKLSGTNAIAILADSADPEAVINAVNLTVQTFGRLDILVNNAGIGLFNSIDNFTMQDFDNITNVNIRAVFAASQAAAKHLGEKGRIINIGSCLAERMSGPGGSLYAMSKAALIGLTKGMARDLGPKGITVNIVHPGPVDTDMNPESGASSDRQKSLMAIPQYGRVDDIANMVAFLANEESQYITGAGFAVDGGTNA